MTNKVSSTGGTASSVANAGTNGYVGTPVDPMPAGFYTTSSVTGSAPAWAGGTAYTVGQKVTQSGTTYTAVAASTGVTPGTDPRSGRRPTTSGIRHIV